MKKSRIPIPTKVASEVLFNADRTCCVCNIPGKAVQIHHIDEVPSNNDEDNLCVLCLQCHDETQTRGGFSNKYRVDWAARVKTRRAKADAIALSQVSSDVRQVLGSSIDRDVPSDDIKLAYVESLPALRDRLIIKAQPEWDSGITAKVVQSTYQYVEDMKAILVQLANMYSTRCFDGRTPQQFVSDSVSERYAWHRAISQPDGPGSGGSIVNITIGGRVRSDLEKMVEEMAMEIVGYDDRFEWRKWAALWNV